MLPFSSRDRVVAVVLVVRRVSVAEATVVMTGAIVSSATAAYVKSVPGTLEVKRTTDPVELTVTAGEVIAAARAVATLSSVSVGVLTYSYVVEFTVTRYVHFFTVFVTVTSTTFDCGGTFVTITTPTWEFVT